MGAGGVKYLDFKLYYKVTVIKNQYCSDRNVDEWNRTASAEITHSPMANL